MDDEEGTAAQSAAPAGRTAGSDTSGAERSVLPPDAGPSISAEKPTSGEENAPAASEEAPVFYVRPAAKPAWRGEEIDLDAERHAFSEECERCKRSVEQRGTWEREDAERRQTLIEKQLGDARRAIGDTMAYRGALDEWRKRRVTSTMQIPAPALATSWS